MRDLKPLLRLLGALLLFAGLCGQPARAADDPDVRELMTPEEFNAAGLERLSPQEIEALNRWLIRYTAKEAPVQRRASVAVREAMKEDDVTEIRTRIVGDFAGWDGKTVFRLENGQVWQQRIDGHFRKRLSSPEVVISKNVLGLWMLRVVEGDRAVGVKRIQ